MVAVNVAVAISQGFHKKAVLIEGDMRKPSLSFPGYEHAKGLSNYLSDETPLQEILIRFHEDNLRIIPAGPPSLKASELIGLKKMEELVRSLRDFGEETYTVIDSPPLLATSDPLLLSTMVDGIILVIMADRTPRESIQRALKLIDRKQIIAVVLNQAQVKSSGYYYRTIERANQ